MTKKFKPYLKRIVLLLFDAAMLIIACLISVFLLSGFFGGIKINVLNLHTLSYSIIYIFLVILSMIAFKIYKNVWRYANSVDYLVCAGAIFLAWVVSLVLVFFLGLWEKISQIYCTLTFTFSVLMIVFGRVIYRVMYPDLSQDSRKEKKYRTMVVGAGYAGNIIINEMLQPSSEYSPVVAVDDANDKIGRYIHGVKIEGTIDNIPKIAKDYSVSKIVIAIPSCTGSRRKKIVDICGITGCEIKLLPYIHKLTATQNFLDQAKEINIEDLLGRDAIQFSEEKNRKLIKGKVCMVTGGGGSIGSELSRQIALNNPKKLIIVDIYENNAYEIQQELVRDYGGNLDLDVIIASVRDYDKMDKIFDRFHPDIVFHAAAHKHVPLMEDSPTEAIKNNIFGTYNIALLAEKYDVSKFVLVSTDKAVNPTNVMGATKRCCEMIIEYMKQTCKGKTEFVAVRFGNVLGSNGSVVPLFKEQIKSGGPVTVTHPDIIRFFMTIPEATSLILQAAGFAHGGEIFVLDMGEPVKILTLAENVIKLSGKIPYEEIKIEFTGLRPGEKLYEELLMNEEGLAKTENNKIFIGKQTEVDISKFNQQLEELRKVANANDDKKCVDMLASIVTTFKRTKAEK
ncbi:MAG: polysaccharide biosynthesis protein [Clostridia bacterium]|nr:polysaccharide biosynthesis protein [Clostridia bacterium]